MLSRHFTNNEEMEIRQFFKSKIYKNKVRLVEKKKPKKNSKSV